MSATINAVGRVTREFQCNCLAVSVAVSCQEDTAKECISALSDVIPTYIDALEKVGAKLKHKSKLKIEQMVERHRSGSRSKKPGYDEEIGYRAGQTLVVTSDYTLERVVDILSTVKNLEYTDDVEIVPYLSGVRAIRENLVAEAVDVAKGKAISVCKALGKEIAEITNIQIGCSDKEINTLWDYDLEPTLSVENLLISTCLEETSDDDIGRFMRKSEDSISEMVAMGAFEDSKPKKLTEEIVLTFSIR